MKICALIAEYNPFHLGHLKHIDYIKNELGAEKIIVFMSGNFTQRGEVAVLDKFTRAKHAVISGADAVIELPTVFATANAETFAKGAIKLICSTGIIDGICFGVESGNSNDYIELAKILNNESKDFKRALKSALDNGVSLAKAKAMAVKELYGDRFDEKLLSSPNNILGLEYTKALLKTNANVEIVPMKREGDHNDKNLKKGITSASSIRETLKTGKKKKLKKNLPPYVYQDLEFYPFLFEKLVLSKLISTPEDRLKRISDCTEGLENRIKALSKDNIYLDAMVEKITTKRYPSTRIRRILTANFLEIDNDLVSSCLSSPLYLKVLAINSDSMDIISTLNKSASVPILTRKSDSIALKKTALYCFEKDVLASDLYALITSKKQNEHLMLII